jgi:(1->4)-alpha-D-glucan 1-alpha-D-glucosylmutase
MLTATYRLQMNAQFRLADARRWLPYFADLGVSHLYLSPIVASRRGSMHGYDVVDPTRINPEIGTLGEFRELASDAAARDMGLLIDIVPNHMGIGPENRFWDDVLMHGERSPYARWFDIDWAASPDGHHKVVLPVLGAELNDVLAKGELSVAVETGKPPRVVYYKQSFPVDVSTLPPELQLATTDAEETGELAAWFSGVKGRDRLRALLEAQHYRLVFWRRGPAEINYRRFFEVNDLAALRIEDDEVFRETHAFILSLVEEGIVAGLRVDHVDGLRDPRAYLERLRAAVPADTPIFVEKILSPGERLRQSWPVQGTTGYEFLNDLEDLFVAPDGFAAIDDWYRERWRGDARRFEEIARAGKTRVLVGPLHADVDRVLRLLLPLVRAAEKHWTNDDVRAALVGLSAALPVYRTYIDGHPGIDEADRAVIERAASTAAQHAPAHAATIELIADLLLDRVPGVDAAARLRFIARWQQVTSPATAKGVEDTALYVYVPLASRNEVGGAPDRPLDDAVARFHRANAARAAQWPLCLTATDTHDTKRSADVRSRLDALSELPDEWRDAVERWREYNARRRGTNAADGTPALDAATEYLYYQILVALWRPGTGRATDLQERINEYMLKAAHEAKVHTSWTDPNADYERRLRAFVDATIGAGADPEFLEDVRRFVARIALTGRWNALSRIALHLTSPGTPDTYQGDEMWNFTLVDPDNRRPVDYGARTALLAELSGDTAGKNRDASDGAVKLAIVRTLLHLRRERAELFQTGDYHPLSAEGERAQHVVAFSRSRGGRSVITIAGRLSSPLVHAAHAADWWNDTVVPLPPELRGREWTNRIAPDSRVHGDFLELGSLLRTIPVAVLAD